MLLCKIVLVTNCCFMTGHNSAHRHIAAMSATRPSLSQAKPSGPEYTMAAIDHQLQCLIGQHFTQSVETLSDTAKLKHLHQQVHQAEVSLMMDRGQRQRQLSAIRGEQLQLERVQLQVQQAAKALQEAQANKIESKARLNDTISQGKYRLKVLQVCASVMQHALSRCSFSSAFCTFVFGMAQRLTK